MTASAKVPSRPTASAITPLHLRSMIGVTLVASALAGCHRSFSFDVRGPPKTEVAFDCGDQRIRLTLDASGASSASAAPNLCSVSTSAPITVIAHCHSKTCGIGTPIAYTQLTDGETRTFAIEPRPTIPSP